VYGDGEVLILGMALDNEMHRATATRPQIADLAARIWRLRGLDFQVPTLISEQSALFLEVVTLDGTALVVVEYPEQRNDEDAPFPGRCARPEARDIASDIALFRFAPSGRPWIPDGIWASISLADKTGSETPLQWPLHQGLDSIGVSCTDRSRCALLRGADMEAVLAVAGKIRVSDSTTLSQTWRSNNRSGGSGCIRPCRVTRVARSGPGSSERPHSDPILRQ
jgi:hypothetical protein